MKMKLLSLLMMGAISSTLYGAEDGATLYKKCAGCHGASGEKVALGKSKIIKNLKKAEFVSALKGYKAGTYGGAMKGVMAGQVKTLSDAQMEAIAGIIAK
jgi:cytochrome c553